MMPCVPIYGRLHCKRGPQMGAAENPLSLSLSLFSLLLSFFSFYLPPAASLFPFLALQHLNYTLFPRLLYVVDPREVK